MKPFDVCPVCGGELKSKRVEKLIRGGKNIAAITVEAEVCLKCGERLYRSDDVRKFEEIRKNLMEEEVSSYHPLGRSFEIA